MYEELAHNVSAVDRGRLTEVIFPPVFDACSEDTIKQKTARLTWDFKINWNTVLKNEEKSPPPGVEKSFWFEAGSAMILVHWINEPVYFQPWVEPDATLEMSSDGID
ncbi:10585_t:CDS:2 [Entrophospora sp. SA101]|nr:6977_t:CDS:2 [Entrophospora sp. SA101]CAJ0764588.1 10585_t:CDS:2 [Entrophospora sp. SA101]